MVDDWREKPPDEWGEDDYEEDEKNHLLYYSAHRDYPHPDHYEFRKFKLVFLADFPTKEGEDVSIRRDQLVRMYLEWDDSLKNISYHRAPYFINAYNGFVSLWAYTNRREYHIPPVLRVSWSEVSVSKKMESHCFHIADIPSKPEDELFAKIDQLTRLFESWRFPLRGVSVCEDPYFIDARKGYCSVWAHYG